jgi:PIN domain
MATNYVLIDFENVQPANLELLKQHPFRVLVFVGANQSKVPFELAAAMQSLGEAGQYIRIAGNGKNALDFHIAYYLGELAAKDSGAYFHIISRDTGFDQVITHLKTRGINVQRRQDLAEIPVIRMSTTISPDDKVAAILKNLAGRGQSRPRKFATLSNTINSIFAGKLSEQQLAAIIQDLEKRKYITLNNANVSYQLPN